MTHAPLKALAVIALLPAAMAQAQDSMSLDTSGDGLVSIEEMQAVHSDISTEQFLEMDSDGDGLLNADELAAASEAGLLPTSEG
ncbi:hypothetical protein ACN2XU_17990 [Primorskyibacter sp. 2E107]|uniref:hypothetical protein n=1 Tax=Primorskyibacter sp. 2E107 TaxID=3403458 RepID=UPI003AF6EA9F